MCKQRVTHDVRAEDLTPGELAVILGKVRVVYRVEHLGQSVLVEDHDHARHYMSPERRVTVHSEGER